MNKLIVVFCVVLAQIKDLTAHNLNVERADKYIKFQRSQQMQALQEFNNKLEEFNKDYTGRVKNLNVQYDLVSVSFVEMEDYLHSLEVLDDGSYKCVLKYRNKLPNIATAKSAITKCIQNANNEFRTLITAPLNIRNEMQNLFNNYFEAEIKKCGYNLDKTTEKYASCITDVASNTNKNIPYYQKNFVAVMDAAECTAKANIKRASNCIYTFQSVTNSKIAEVSVYIKNCILGKDECKSCPAACSEILDLQVDYEKQTILNPFYKRKSHNGCLLLNIKN